MSLATLQNALSCLLTDETARNAFISNPAESGASWQLTVEETKALQVMVAHDIPEFAQALQAKRCAEVSDLLPRTRRALKGDFVRLFKMHATHFVPVGTHKVRSDAVQFAAWLQKQFEVDKATRQMALYESYLLCATDRRWRIGRFQLAKGNVIAACGRGRVFHWPRHIDIK